jgi:bacteriorhodopsin
MKTLKRWIPGMQMLLVLFGAYSMANLIDDVSPAGIFAGVLLAVLPAAGYAALADRTRTRWAWFGIGLSFMLVSGALLRLFRWN